MSVSAILFGAIGTIAETSDIQRRAYNMALAEAGVPWEWDVEVYSDLLEQSGGKDRLHMLSAATGAGLSAATIDRIHARKTEIAGVLMAESAVQPRPGVTALIKHARAQAMRIGFVTTTYRPNIDAILAAIAREVDAAAFDVIVTRDDVARGKPWPDCFDHALGALGLGATEAIAIEDTAISVMAAKRAGLFTIATPGALTAAQDFWQADLVLPALADADGGIDARVLAALG